jgi:alkylated DNA repair dioxygenase AlkB
MKNSSTHELCWTGSYGWSYSKTKLKPHPTPLYLANIRQKMQMKADEEQRYWVEQVSQVKSKRPKHLPQWPLLPDVYYDAILTNRYVDGGQSVGRHADNETDICEDSTISSLSIGNGMAREFVMTCMGLKGTNASKAKIRGDLPTDPPLFPTLHLTLQPGSLLLMMGACQRFFVHQLLRLQDSKIGKKMLKAEITKLEKMDMIDKKKKKKKKNEEEATSPTNNDDDDDDNVSKSKSKSDAKDGKSKAKIKEAKEKSKILRKTALSNINKAVRTRINLTARTAAAPIMALKRKKKDDDIISPIDDIEEYPSDDVENDASERSLAVPISTSSSSRTSSSSSSSSSSQKKKRARLTVHSTK